MADLRTKPTAIEKALDVLVAFLPARSEMGTVEISRSTGFHVATVNRILQVLAKKRFLQQNPTTRKFALGPLVLALGKSVIESLSDNLLQVSIPHLNELCERVRETVVLEAITGMHGLAAYVAQGKQTLSIRATIGTRLPTHAAAGCKAIIAFSDPDTINRFLNKKMGAFTPKTITDPQTLKAELAKIRKSGIAYAREELELGINAIAMPIIKGGGKPVGAVSVVGPSSRIKCIPKSPIVPELEKTVQSISSHPFQAQGRGRPVKAPP
ncbi:MAG: IclR family transcriptional regulator [Deltaproteobacteria bacterium]|nr:IclR family transcriptional regulator [Deltaproteobacteria bacterium]